MSAPLLADSLDPERWKVGELDASRRRLGAAAGATRLGVALIEISPGARSTPPHSHIDEDELFLVVSGGGLSWQSSGSRDVRTYEIGEGDLLFHPAGGDAHTLIAGTEGLTVLVLAEGSRTHLTWMPRTKMFWVGPRWVPTDAPPPFAADADAGPLEAPPPTRERPASIVRLADCPVQEKRRGRFGTHFRDPGRAAGCQRLVLAVDEVPAGLRTYPRHWHTAREECFYVLGGSGSVQLGDASHELGPGSFFLRAPNSRVSHAIDAGPSGLTYVTMGDLVPGDVCVYPDSNKVSLGRGLYVRAEPLDYYDGEPDAGDPPVIS